jgi:hypothetical protein
MFQNIRKGATLYVLNKQDATLEVGEVVNVTPPQPMYNTQYQGGFNPPRMCVDIEVTANGKVINLQKLTADATIDDKNGIIVAENRDAILNEIEVLSKNSQRIIESCEYHNEIVTKCNALIAELNPQLKREAEQAREINDLRQQLSDIKGMLADVLNKKTKEG